MNRADVSGGSPFSLPNIRLFIAFRCLFNARFYYPVFTILFLDYGLTIEQFSLLNTVWAVTIVCSEVPSGALADVIGRRYLLITTTVLMILEMCTIAFLPLGNSTLIFWAFFINRVLSGLAEAMASGADEAIAYDTLVEKDLKKTWPQVLSVTYRLQAFVAVITLTLGSLIYSPKSVNTVLHFLGFTLHLDQHTTMRFPILATLVLAICTFILVLQMKEVGSRTDEGKTSIIAAFKKTAQAGRWIAQTPFALVIILFGMCCDHVLRLIATVTSQYFRCIDLPDASFGIIGATMSMLGIMTPKVAEWMSTVNSPRTNMLYVSALTLTALFGLAGFYHWWGILFVGITFITMTLISFFVSNYLNIITDSHQRATVLSFKGMAFNIAYGAIGFFFALLLNHFRTDILNKNPAVTHARLEDLTFIQGIKWLPWYTVVFLIILLIIGAWLLRGNTKYQKPLVKEDS